MRPGGNEKLSSPDDEVLKLFILSIVSSSKLALPGEVISLGSLDVESSPLSISIATETPIITVNEKISM